MRALIQTNSERVPRLCDEPWVQDWQLPPDLTAPLEERANLAGQSPDELVAGRPPEPAEVCLREAQQCLAKDQRHDGTGVIAGGVHVPSTISSLGQ